MVIIDENELKTLRIDAERCQFLENENTRLRNEISDLKEKVKDKDVKPIKIEFRTFIKTMDNNLLEFLTIDKDLISTIDFAVDYENNGIVGYERQAIFGKLKELAEAMKVKLQDYIDDKHNKIIKKINDDYNDLHKSYVELYRKVERFNKKHLFKVKIGDE